MYYGRRKIMTDIETVTRDNLIGILDKALAVHRTNRAEEKHLWEYYKGKTPILGKEKVYRDEINNIINENRAMQIVEFYQGYVFGEPITYIRKGKDESLNDEIEWLNENMDKLDQDNDLAEYMLVTGVCPRLVLPEGGHPQTYTIAPWNAFNVYANNLSQETVLSVIITVKEDKTEAYSCYTKNAYYYVEGGKIVEEAPHIMGKCPMAEYTLNNVRMGIFEPVMALLDAIDMLQSNRIDDVAQFVDSILAVFGGEITEEVMAVVKETGAMSLPDGVDAKYLNSALRQGDVQTLKNDLMTAVTEITGMPNRNGGSSTSDTGSAVMLRDGWETADAKSKRIEIQFKKAEKQMLGVYLGIAESTDGIVLDPSAVEIRFTRRNYENIQTKAQVLTQMLSSGKIAPELAFQHSGMFSDPLLAYEMSKKYSEEVQERFAERNQMSQVQEAPIEE